MLYILWDDWLIFMISAVAPERVTNENTNTDIR